MSLPTNRSLARRALELRDDLLTEHLATLRRVQRLVLDGSLVRADKGCFVAGALLTRGPKRKRRKSKKSSNQWKIYDRNVKSVSMLINVL